MLKFEFVVTGMELTDEQKERISTEFPALVTKAVAREGADEAAKFWCLCKVDGRSMFAHDARDAHERRVRPKEDPPQTDRPLPRLDHPSPTEGSEAQPLDLM